MHTNLPEPKIGYPPDFDYCHKVIKAGSKSFHLASLCLPGHVRRAVFATYAFCREADDAVDLGADPSQAVEMLSERLEKIYSGRPDAHPIDRAFASVVSNYNLPRALPEGLLEGMQWDAEGCRYQTLDDLMNYAARVAGTVGAMMTIMMGNSSRDAVARASDLGIAMQLTNIARDIGEDARAGRLYLPESWLSDVGLSVSTFLEDPHFRPEVADLTKRLLDAAEPLYARGLSGVELLPARCRASIRAAGIIYREIGAEIQNNNYDSVSQRAYVSRSRKLQLLAGAVVQRDRSPQKADALAASAFLVDAVAPEHLDASGPIPQTRALWVLDLFSRLEARDQQSYIAR